MSATILCIRTITLFIMLHVLKVATLDWLLWICSFIDLHYARLCLLGIGYLDYVSQESLFYSQSSQSLL